MQRQRLRRHPLVLAALSRWWDVALLTARRRRSTACGLSFRDYVNVYLLLSAELLPPEEHDPAECEAEAREEWERDSAGGGGGESSTMQRIQFLDSVFELSGCLRRLGVASGGLLLGAPPPPPPACATGAAAAPVGV